MQPIKTKLNLKGAIPPILGPAVPTIYLGMLPVEVLGVNRATTAVVRGASVGGIEYTAEQKGSSGIRQVDRLNAIRRSKAQKRKNTTSGATKRHVGGVSRTRSKLRKTTSKKTSGIRTITRKDGRKVYMKNGKFIRKP